MTLAQVLYPLIACAEACLLFRARSSQAGLSGALRVWLIVELCIFCVLEPGSFLPLPIWTAIYLVSTVASFAADFVVLYGVFSGIEGEVRAFGDKGAWGKFALILGLSLCLLAFEAIPTGARGIQVVWLTTSQVLQYLRMSGLIAIALYGWVRASSWPRDLAWAWLGLAVYSGADAIGERLALHFSAFGGNFQYLSTAALAFQLYAWWMSVSYQPDPLTPSDKEFMSQIAEGPL